jgi:hypothetical protein
MSDTYNNAPPYARRDNPVFRQFTPEQWRRLFHLAALPTCPPEKRRFLLRIYRQAKP